MGLLLREEVFKTIRELTLALSRCWLVGRGSRQTPGYLDQELDKLAVLYSCARQGTNEPHPLLLVPGRHGHGLALVDHVKGSSPLFFPELLTMLLGIHKPEAGLGKTSDDATSPFLITKSKWGNYFEPRLGEADCDKRAYDIGKETDAFSNEFAGLVRPMSQEQTIALGRHWSTAKTGEALDYLLRKTRDYVADIQKAAGPDQAWVAVREANEVAREQWNKVFEDQGRYHQSWEIVVESPIVAAGVRGCILAQRQEKQVIWHAETVNKRWLPLATAAKCWCELLWSGFQIGPCGVVLEGRTAEHPVSEFEEAWTEWCKLELNPRPVFPREEVLAGKFMEVRNLLYEGFRQLIGDDVWYQK